MNPTRLLLLMSRWARNPPSKQRVYLVLGVIAACLLIYAAEQYFGWFEGVEARSLRRISR